MEISSSYKQRVTCSYKNVFTEVSDMAPEIYSQKFEVHTIQWSVNLEIRMVADEKCINVYLSCDHLGLDKEWSCMVTGALEVQRQQKKFMKVFTAKERKQRFWEMYQPLQQLIERGFILCGLDEMEIKLDIVILLPRKHHFGTTEFYNYLDTAYADLDNLQMEKRYNEIRFEEKLKKIREDRDTQLKTLKSEKNMMEQWYEGKLKKLKEDRDMGLFKNARLDDENDQLKREVKGQMDVIDKMVKLYETKKQSKAKDAPEGEQPVEEPEEIRDLIEHLKLLQTSL